MDCKSDWDLRDEDRALLGQHVHVEQSNKIPTTNNSANQYLGKTNVGSVLWLQGR